MDRIFILITASAIIFGGLLAVTTALFVQRSKRSQQQLNAIEGTVKSLALGYNPVGPVLQERVRRYLVLDDDGIMQLYNQILPEGGPPSLTEVEQFREGQSSVALK